MINFAAALSWILFWNKKNKKQSLSISNERCSEKGIVVVQYALVWSIRAGSTLLISMMERVRVGHLGDILMDTFDQQ